MATTTINQIMKAFEEIASDHYQINTFFGGNTWDFEAKTNIFPAMIVITMPSNIQKGRILYKFSIYLADILNKDRSNVYEIESDMFMVCNDIISELKYKYNIYGFMLDETDILLEPFEEAMDDVTSGWKMDITIEAVNDSCNTAFKSKSKIF